MKKIILFIFTLFVMLNKVSATTFHMGEKLNPLFYVQRSDGTRTHNGLLFKLLREDGEFVYCIEPFETRVSSAEYTEYNYNNSTFGLNDSDLNMLNLIAYFGYGYQNHTDIKWYGITQFLIWTNLTPRYNVFLTDTLYGNKIEPYNNEINEIYNLIDNYNKLPSFSNNTLTYTKNKTYELIDTNNVLSTYEILDTNIDVVKEDNKLIINTKEDGIYTINFIKRSPIQREYKLYYANNTQNFLYPGKINDIKFNLTIKVISGEIKLNKIGLTSSIESTLEGAIYGVFQNDLQIGTITTDNNGYGYIDGLSIGEYTVKELVPSTGYTLDKSIYDVRITPENRSVYIESYEKLIYDYLTISKYYGEEDNYILEEGAVFSIYDSTSTLYGTYETKKGKLDIVLPYGKYRVIQTSGKEGYKLVEPFNITIDEFSFNNYELYDEVIKGDLVLTKYAEYNKEDGAIFEIYEDDTLYGTYETVDGSINIKLPYGNYKVKQIKGIEGYKYVKDFDVFINEEKEYEYDLYDELIYGNLILNKYYGEKDNYNREDDAIFSINDTEYKTIDGIISLELPYGNYSIKQISGKEGYKYIKDFDVFINEEKEYEYDLYDELIYGNLILNKYYGEKDNYNREDGAIFKVSNETNMYEGITDDGILSMSLPYGNYRVTQLKGIEGYDYVEDFDIDITEETSDYDLYDEIIVNVPNTGIYNKINYSFLIYIFFGLVLIIYSLKKTTQ